MALGDPARRVQRRRTSAGRSCSSRERSAVRHNPRAPYRSILRHCYSHPYTTRQGWSTTSPAAGLERRHLRTNREDHDRTRAIAKDELVDFLAASHPLRDKTLWWMLYETGAAL